MWLKETNASKPLMTCRNVFIDVETGIWTSVPRARVGGSLPTAQPASGMKGRDLETGFDKEHRNLSFRC